jgi:polyvinyl alcohol dehydrogenase (cytochrome)
VERGLGVLAGPASSARRASGAVAWSHSISDYTGVAADTSRTSPAVYGSELVLGDGSNYSPSRAGAYLMAVDRTTGQKLWVTQVDSHPAAIITSSPVVNGGIVYAGVSSKEETFGGPPGYLCCTFRGKVVALDAATGRLL